MSSSEYLAALFNILTIFVRASSFLQALMPIKDPLAEFDMSIFPRT